MTPLNFSFISHGVRRNRTSLQTAHSQGQRACVEIKETLRDKFLEGKDKRLLEELYTISPVVDTELNAPVRILECLCLIFQEPDETALHLAVRSVDRTSLHIVDFLVQNR